MFYLNYLDYLNYLSRLEPSSSFDVTGVNVALAMAGLTFRVNELLDHPGTTFMRRALRAPLDVLTDDAARNLLLRTAALTPLRFREDAARLAADAVRNYPYIVQVIGESSWARAHSAGSAEQFVRAMAGLVVDDGPVAIADEVPYSVFPGVRGE